MKPKILFWSFLVFLILVLGARFFWLVKESDVSLPEKIIKEKLSGQGFDLEYASFKLNFSFVPGVEILDAKLTRIDGETESPLAKIERINIDFELLTFLLTGQFSIDHLEINHALININRDISGANNWFPDKEGKSQKLKANFELFNSSFKDVEIVYSGPSFTDQHFIIKQAAIVYTKDDVLQVHEGKLYYQNQLFDIDGRINTLIAFLSGKGSLIDFTITQAEQSLEVSLRGDLDERSLPAMSGLRIQAHGTQLTSWLAMFKQTPTINTDEFRLNALLKSKGDDFYATIDELVLQCQSNSVRLLGSLADQENEISYRLLFDGKGIDIHSLQPCSSLFTQSGFFKENVDNLHSDFFRLEGKLAGKNKNLKLSDVKLDVQSDSDLINLQFSTDDLLALSNLSGRVLVAGKNLAQLAGKLSSWYQAPIKLPETDSYRSEFSFFIDRDWSTVEVNMARAELTSEGTYLKLVQAPDTSATKDDFEFHVDSKGNNLAYWIDAYEGIKIPENLAYGFKGKVYKSQNALGFGDSELFLSKGQNRANYTGDFSLEKNITSIEGAFVFDGQETMLMPALIHRTLDSLNNLDDGEQDIHLKGKLSGNNQQFTFKQFSYRGRRGNVNGNFVVDLTNKPEIDAQLGEVTLISQLDNKSKSSLDYSQFSLDWLDYLNLKLSYESLKLLINDAEFDWGRSTVSMQDGRLNWKNFSLSYLATKITGSWMIDAKKDAYQLMLDARQLDFGSLFKELDWFDRLQAVGDFRMSLEGSGNTIDDVLSRMKGSGKVYFSNGKVKGFGSTSTSYIRASMPWRKNMDDLEIDCFMSRLLVENGKMRTRNLFLSNRNMYLMGGGQLDLASRKVDMAFSPRARSANFFDANVTLFVQGALADPSVKLGKLSTVSDVGVKYGQWALLGPLALAIPKLPVNRPPTCEQALSLITSE